MFWQNIMDILLVYGIYDFELSRQKYFNCNSLSELFEKTSEANIMSYLKEIGLYSRF